MLPRLAIEPQPAGRPAGFSLGFGAVFFMLALYTIHAQPLSASIIVGKSLCRPCWLSAFLTQSLDFSIELDSAPALHCFVTPAVTDDLILDCDIIA